MLVLFGQGIFTITGLGLHTWIFSSAAEICWSVQCWLRRLLEAGDPAGVPAGRCSKTNGRKYMAVHVTSVAGGCRLGWAVAGSGREVTLSRNYHYIWWWGDQWSVSQVVGSNLLMTDLRASLWTSQQIYKVIYSLLLSNWVLFTSNYSPI